MDYLQLKQHMLFGCETIVIYKKRSCFDYTRSFRDYTPRYKKVSDFSSKKYWSLIILRDACKMIQDVCLIVLLLASQRTYSSYTPVV